MLEPAHIDQPRILMRIRSMVDSNVFDAHYTAMHPGEVDRLYQQSVSLVGITTPIVGHASNKTLNAPAHFQSHMTILG